jgi:uncharacterized protein with HEPN domain
MTDAQRFAEGHTLEEFQENRQLRYSIERALEIIGHCAAPSFRDDLRQYYEESRECGGHIPHDLSTVFDWTDM